MDQNGTSATLLRKEGGGGGQGYLPAGMGVNQADLLPGQACAWRAVRQ